MAKGGSRVVGRASGERAARSGAPRERAAWTSAHDPRVCTLRGSPSGPECSGDVVGASTVCEAHYAAAFGAAALARALEAARSPL